MSFRNQGLFITGMITLLYPIKQGIFGSVDGVDRTYPLSQSIWIDYDQKAWSYLY
jgi:hypothetical protein